MIRGLSSADETYCYLGKFHHSLRIRRPWAFSHGKRTCGQFREHALNVLQVSNAG